MLIKELTNLKKGAYNTTKNCRSLSNTGHGRESDGYRGERARPRLGGVAVEAATTVDCHAP